MSWYLRQDCRDHDILDLAPCLLPTNIASYVQNLQKSPCSLIHLTKRSASEVFSVRDNVKVIVEVWNGKGSFFAAPSPMWQCTHKWIILCLQDPQTVHQVHHYQITDWPDKGIPKNAQCILDMISMVEQSLRKTSNAPLVVQCRWRKTELSLIYFLALS
mgnify:CR=1 FL=1